jgi:glyoxylase-like metal-dependent hydrolase (beta-lactamase superfamily II)
MGAVADQTRVGDATVSRVVEWLGPIRTVAELFPGTPARVWREHQGELAPHFWDPATGAYRAAIQTWVIEVDGLTVLVDTGVGNDRDRPQIPVFSQLSTGYLDALAAAGVTPADVDVVVNTHIHYDHVGWNTRRAGQGWIPAFPNARYLAPQADYDYFHPENAASMRAPRTEDERRRFTGIRLVFEDSIAPVHEAGQLTTWAGEYEISPTLRLAPAPGHTPGSSVLWLRSGAGAVFVGDLTHSPVQLYRPGDACSFDLDAAAATRSRRAVLREAAARGATVFPAHYPGHGAAVVTADGDGDGFAVRDWAPLPEI